jgi:hypothetical protein
MAKMMHKYLIKEYLGDSKFIVWCEYGAFEKLSYIKGIVRTYGNGSGVEWTLYTDPRYDFLEIRDEIVITLMNYYEKI